jgi:hypothetical protein
MGTNVSEEHTFSIFTPTMGTNLQRNILLSPSLLLIRW